MVAETSCWRFLPGRSAAAEGEQIAFAPMELPASFYDAPWINPGYLVPTSTVDPQPRFKAPYVPFVNECKPGKRRKIHPGQISSEGE